MDSAEGLCPGAILFEPTKEGTIYDYATDKYVPVRFYDYVNQELDECATPSQPRNSRRKSDAAAGLTFLQIGREGWGYQKSQNGGGTIPQPSLTTLSYHRYGSRVPTADKEKSFYDGIDTSLSGIAGLTSGDTQFLTKGLEAISRIG